MRLLSQKIGSRANRDDNEVGKFWQSRFKGVKLLDEASILACAAYVDLNPIRAAIAETLEGSLYTSAQQRVLELQSKAASKGRVKGQATKRGGRGVGLKSIAGSLSPVGLNEGKSGIGVLADQYRGVPGVAGLDGSEAKNGQTWVDAQVCGTAIRETWH
jgi:hypothetical protein